MITLLLIILAAFFNAVMDAVENENYHESIFKKLPVQFWYKRESWKYAPKLFGYRFDAWHISKTLMITCLAIALITAGNWHIKWCSKQWEWCTKIVLTGAVWNMAFTLFYHKIFKVK